MALTGKQRRYLRGLAHSLEPMVMVGNGGISDPVIKQVDIALEAHELIKVRFGDGSEMRAKEGGPLLATASRSNLAQVIGHIAVLYRRRKDNPAIVLPKK